MAQNKLKICTKEQDLAARVDLAQIYRSVPIPNPIIAYDPPTWEQVDAMKAHFEQYILALDLCPLPAKDQNKISKRTSSKRASSKSTTRSEQCDKDDSSYVRGQIIESLEITSLMIDSFLMHANPKMARKYKDANTKDAAIREKNNLASRISRAKNQLTVGLLQLKIHEGKVRNDELREWIRRFSE